jgi:FkbM family methyltransferase
VLVRAAQRLLERAAPRLALYNVRGRHFMKLTHLYATMTGFPGLFGFHTLLHKYALHGMGMHNAANMRLSGEQSVIKDHVATLPKGAVLFDVGAFKGQYTRLLEKYAPQQSRIYCFEPNISVFPELQENLRDLENCVPMDIALSDHVGEREFFVRADREISGHSSFHGNTLSGVHHIAGKRRTVTVTTLDQFCADHDITRIDFLKLDVEGHELQVLQGARQLLDTSSIHAIQFEFTQLNPFVRLFFLDFWDLLSDKYTISRLLPHGLRPIRSYDPQLCEIFAYQNFLAVLKDDSQQ